ncbi:MAG: hypothetical protein ACI9XR_001734 [Flavobacterium sp.]|jgi:hypothetical protein
MRQLLYLLTFIGLLLSGSSKTYAGSSNFNSLIFSTFQSRHVTSITEKHKITFSLPDCTDSEVEEDFMAKDSLDFLNTTTNSLRLFSDKNWNFNFYSKIEPIFIENQFYIVPNFYGTSQPIYLVIRVIRI